MSETSTCVRLDDNRERRHDSGIAAQVVEHPQRRRRLVQCIEVQPRRTAIEQPLAEARDDLAADDCRGGTRG